MEENICTSLSVINHAISKLILARTFKMLLPSTEIIEDFANIRCSSIIKEIVQTKYTHEDGGQSFIEDQMAKKCEKILKTNTFLHHMEKNIKTICFNKSISQRPSASSIASNNFGSYHLQADRMNDFNQDLRTLVPLPIEEQFPNETCSLLIDKLRQRKTNLRRQSGKDPSKWPNLLQTKLKKQLKSLGNEFKGPNKVIYEYDGTIIQGSKSEAIKNQNHYLDLEVEVIKQMESPLQDNSKNLYKNIRTSKVHKKSTRCSHLNTNHSMHEPFKEIINIFSRELSCLPLDNGVSNKQTQQDDRKILGYDPSVNKKKNSLEFLKNNEIEPIQIKMEDLLQFKCSSSTHSVIQSVKIEQLNQVGTESKLITNEFLGKEKLCKVTNRQALCFLINDTEQQQIKKQHKKSKFI